MTAVDAFDGGPRPLVDAAPVMPGGAAVVLTDEEAALVVSALRIPGCWNPRLRQDALRLIARDDGYEEQLRLVTDGAMRAGCREHGGL